MRNKLFFAFLAVVLTALISNLLYQFFITRDFEDYINGTKEDRLYWILASAEGSYADGQWVHRSLHDVIHWAIMLGFDVKILDPAKRELINSEMVIRMLSPSMKRKMKNIEDIKTSAGAFESYPLYHEGREVGSMLVREIDTPSGNTRLEAIFRQRGKTFLTLSFVIVGSGALLLSVIFTLFLSKPLQEMKDAVETMAGHNFSVRLPVTSHDEIGRLSESFNFMAEALEKQEALRKRLTSNIAHELRTPLTVMKANVEAVLDGVITDTRQGMNNIRTELDNMIRLVQGIEDMTKAEASFFEKKEYVLLNLKEFMTMIVRKIMLLASAKNLEITLRGAEEIQVQTDAEKLERICQNILSNALRNTHTGYIRIDYGEEGDWFFIRVADTGTGMERDTLDMIFRRFYRGPDSNGLGLGLAIVRELLDVMGGRIEVESSVGQGSAFTVWLPKHHDKKQKNIAT